MTKIFHRSLVWLLAVVPCCALVSCVATEADVPAEPVVVFPTWSANHEQTQDVRITPAPGWPIALVEYSVDGQKWTQATPGTADATTGAIPYSVKLSGLDIGTNDLTLRVTSAYRDQTQVDYFYSTIEGVAAVFDCAATSMLPSADMIQNINSERRTMTGYFGRAGKHTVTFVLGFANIVNNRYKSVGTTVERGENSITVDFDVREATCDKGNPMNNPHDCDVPYNLTVLVDGVSVCEKENFGNIHTYWRG